MVEFLVINYEVSVGGQHAKRWAFVHIDDDEEESTTTPILK